MLLRGPYVKLQHELTYFLLIKNEVGEQHLILPCALKLANFYALLQHQRSVKFHLDLFIQT